MSVLVIIPTFNEVVSLPVVLERVWAAVPDVAVLVIDDASPDGTGEWAAKLAQTEARLSVLQRAGKRGLGSAYIDGFRWAAERGYEFVVELDADGSHPPERLPAMLAAARADASLAAVIGSRWVSGGSTVNWPRRRQWLSKAANRYAAFMLGMKVCDATAGFRVYRASALAVLDLSDVHSRGYCFQIDMTRRIIANGGSVLELPIEFREREVGESKMSGDIVLEAMLKVTLWGFQRLLPAAKRSAAS